MRCKDIELLPSRVGHAFIKAKMRENEIEFCAEHSGHLFFKEMSYVEAPFLAMLKILNILQATGKDIDTLAAQVSDWRTSEEINFNFKDKGRIAQVLASTKKKYSDGEINEMDGLKVNYTDWNFLLRPSNTEAKLRLIVDAKTEEILTDKKQELLDVIKKYA
jgi:phosphomannomutase